MARKTTQELVAEMLAEQKAKRPGRMKLGEPVEVAKQPEPVAQDNRWEFTKGVSRGIDQTQALGYGVATLLGDAVGADSLGDWGLEGYRRNMDEAGESKARVGRIEDIDGVGDALSWGSGVLGELVPTMATMIATGGIGGAIAKQSAKKLVGDQLKKRVALGQTAGVLGGGIGMETGEIYGDVADQGFRDTGDQAAALAGGTLAGSLEALPVLRIAKAFGFSGQLKKEITGTLRKRMLKEGGKQMGLEGATEFLQTGIEEATKSFITGKNLPEDIGSQLLNAAAAGALGGGVMGAAAGGIAGKGPLQEAAAKAKVEGANPVTGEDFGNSTMKGYGDTLAQIDKKIKATEDPDQKEALVAEAQAILQEITEDHLTPKMDKDGKKIPQKPLQTKEAEDLVTYYSDYLGEKVEVTDIEPETDEQRKARVSEEREAKKGKKKLDEQAAKAWAEADKTAETEATAEVQEAADDQNLATEIEAQIEQNAKDIVTPPKQAGLGETVPELEATQEVVDDVPPYLKSREGLPARNGDFPENRADDIEQQVTETEVPSETSPTGADTDVVEEDEVVGLDEMVPVDPEVEKVAKVAKAKPEVIQEVVEKTENVRRPPQIEKAEAQEVEKQVAQQLDESDAIVVDALVKLIKGNEFTDRSNLDNFLRLWEKKTGISYEGREDELIGMAVDSMQNGPTQAPVVPDPVEDPDAVRGRIDELTVSDLKKAAVGSGIKGYSNMKKPELAKALKELEDPDGKIIARVNKVLTDKVAKKTNVKKAREAKVAERKASMAKARQKKAVTDEQADINEATKEVWDEPGETLYEQANKRKALANLEPKSDSSSNPELAETEADLSVKEQLELEAKRFEEETLRDIGYGQDNDDFGAPDDVDTWSAAAKNINATNNFLSTNYDNRGNYLDRQDSRLHKEFSQHMRLMEKTFNDLVKKITHPGLGNVEFVFVKHGKDLPAHSINKIKIPDGQRLHPGLVGWTGLHTQYPDTGKTVISMNPTKFFNYRDSEKAVAEFKKTFLHEFVGHYGLRRLFDNNQLWSKNNPYDMFLDKIIDTNFQAVRKAVDLAPRWANFVDLTAGGKPMAVKDSKGKEVLITRQSLRKLMDEYLAELATKSEQLGAWTKAEKNMMKRLVVWVKHKLAPLLGMQRAKVTNQDIFIMIGNSYENLYGSGIRRPKVEAIRNIMASGDADIEKGLKGDMGEVVQYSAEPEGYNQAIDDGALPEIDANEAKSQKQEALRAAAGQGVDVSDILSTESITKDGYGTIRQNAVSKIGFKYWQAFRDKFPGMYTLFNARGTLRNYDMKNAQAMNALGKMGNDANLGKEALEVLKRMNQAQSSAIMDYFKDAQGNINSLNVSESDKRKLMKYKERIMEFGERLVELGYLDPDTYYKNMGGYLPIQYLAYNYRTTGAGRKGSPMTYLLKREPMTETEKNLLGEFVDPASIIPSMLTMMGRDVALAEYTDTIMNLSGQADLGWVLGDKAITRWGDGEKTSVTRAEQSIEQWKEQLKDFESGGRLFGQQPEKVKQLNDAIEWTQGELDAWNKQLNDKIRSEMNIPLDQPIPESDFQSAIGERYKKMPDERGYGALKGQWVRKEIYDEFVESTLVSEDMGSIAEALGPGGKIDRVNQIWKSMKVPFNLPSWVRNSIGNLVLLDISTPTNIASLTKSVWDEFQLARRGNPSIYWQEAHKRGLFGTTFSSNEIFLLSKEISTLREAQMARDIKTNEGQFKSGFMKAQMTWWKVSEALSNAYGNVEGIFKTVAMKDYIERWKKQEGVKSLDDLNEIQRTAVLNQSVIAANQAIFDYSELTAWQKDLRRSAFGAPFITYTMKAAPATARGLAKNPQKFAKYLALPYAFMGAAMMGLGDLTPDDIEEWEKNQAKWMKDKSSVYVLPIRDANGKLQPIDFGYWFPWAPWQDLALKTTSNFKDAETPSEIGLSTLKSSWEGVNGMGLLGGPIPTVLAAVLTNKETFLGRDIVSPGDSASVGLAKILNWSYTLMAPPWLTDQGVTGKMMDHYDLSITGLPNRNIDAFGEQKATMGGTLLRGVGVSTYPTSIEELKLSKAKDFRRQVMELKRARTKAARNLGWSQEKRVSEIKDINRRISLLQKKMKDDG